MEWFLPKKEISIFVKADVHCRELICFCFVLVLYVILALLSGISWRATGELKGQSLSRQVRPASSAHQHKLSGRFFLKAKQKYHGTTQGPDLDFSRWWVVALKSRPDLFFLLASPFSPFHWGISQSPLPADTCTHSRTANIIPLKYSSFSSAAHGRLEME